MIGARDLSFLSWRAKIGLSRGRTDGNHRQTVWKTKDASARRAFFQETEKTCLGITAVIRRAEAVLQALIIMRSSISPSLMSPGAVLCSMNTGRFRHGDPGDQMGYQAYHLRLGHW